MNREAVRDYIQQSESIFEASPQMDEANTKAAVLRDFLDLLDWQIPTNTQLEYPVEAFGQTYKVDYALLLEGTPFAFVEAKGADTALTTKHAEQLKSYMTNKNVNYGILTNGKQYRLFQRRLDSDNVSVEMIGDVALQDLEKRFASLNAYTESAIESGQSKKILNRINELREAKTILQREKDEISTELTNLLTERTADTISSLAEPQFKQTIDKLVDEIESEINSDSTKTESRLQDDEETTIEPQKNHVAGAIARAEIDGNGDARVAVFPTQKSGLVFLVENNAWGFVKIGSEFDYVAMYVTSGESEVRYFARVRDIVAPDEADLVRPAEEYVDRAKIGEGKKVVRFEPGSLYELEDPVPYKTKYPQSLQYTTLNALRNADTTDDML
ncbi:type I restriction enzyme HsdR N-terminal domain-containing protein [Halococcus salsus]|uniref:type I restriction enzyme HsdR N-terminal domain-containing protein n=1 Tax=Halococcus salsus TaxID=2162894 RepID=UPI001358FC65|nr:type I restriction enzyme HsdR N-terminal domain-containing protein [Halococcus salsus]